MIRRLEGAALAAGDAPDSLGMKQGPVRPQSSKGTMADKVHPAEAPVPDSVGQTALVVNVTDAEAQLGLEIGARPSCKPSWKSFTVSAARSMPR